MPAPIAAALIWGYRAYRIHQAYEAAQTAKEVARMASDIAKRREEVKRVLKSVIESFSKEIHEKSSTFAKVDAGGRSTVSRRGAEGATYKEYIERKIPFRPAISVACNWALSSPLKVPRRIRKKIPGSVIETTIEVALKQTTASLVFEAIDNALDWKSPLKAEPNYLNGQPLLGEPATKPKRTSEIFPFWPRPRGSLAPDLVIVEYRQQPFHVPNVFVVVEIKFPNDWVKQKQLSEYADLMQKNKRKVALLRVPEDCTGYTASEDGKGGRTSGQAGGKGRR
ncbi:VRR-NUC domain-containing protein [Pseudomonas citronellolis]|jgi:hypothetical protein|uniref:VRR-NUC domain-containing protein n=1 Tax=Pseudomonas citronellolis TaxID=53408 RepID=A0AAW6P6G3_9PSED|nr:MULTISPECIES: VRR-NUC domain-containing protein [Pseudomonas]MDF3841931.1 VRR-NUC domain-containing protein [Pseudomonas citronellolis]NTY22816.1 VRR-NUC domain-containing protein [Pseudomonas sp. UMC3103]NTY28319.1 VRR-NUC domain-containing protein [Pseudomonas sp. UMA603]NTY34796.1 VRR-NUC domain-containing protein [Pseudomonas sp. UMC3129]NTY57222.1 VRR-NUC domain-containing protein [Pseudomonas sp. UMC631]